VTADVISTWFDAWAAEYAPGSTLQISAYDSADLGNRLLTVNQLPDIVIDTGESLAAYATAGVLIPLDGLVDTSPYDVNVLAGAQVFGSTYGIPLYSGNHLMLMVNTALTSVPQTFDEALAIAQSFSGSEVDGLLFPIADPHYLMPFVFGFGGEVFDSGGEFVLNTQAWVDAFAFVRQLAAFVPTGCDAQCVETQFANGSAAMIITGDWSLVNYLSNPDVMNILQTAPLPILPNGERARPYLNVEYASISITADSAKIAAASAFLNWITTDANVVLNAAAAYGRLPSNVGLQNDIASDPILSASLEAFNSGVLVPSDTRTLCLWSALESVLSGVLNDFLSAEDAAAQAQDLAAACGANLS
jgi:maltose-binding protein MalE